jgi:hypothetical protein
MTQRILSGRARQRGDTSAAPANVSAALVTLQDANQKISQITRAHRDTLIGVGRDVRADPNLSDEGRRAALLAAGMRVVAASTAELAAVRSATDAASTALDTAAARATPAPIGGVEGLLGRQAAWARARSLLASGIAADELITETADPETLAMLLDELPTWARSLGASPDVVAHLPVLIAERYADLAATPAGAAAIRVDLLATPYEAALPFILTSAEAVVSNPQPTPPDLNTALQARLIFERAQSALNNGPEEIDDASDQRRIASDSLMQRDRQPTGR